MEERAQQDLELIRQIMDDSRREVVDRGSHFLIWGLVPLAGLVATYVRATTGEGPSPLWVWVAVLVAGWTASMVIGFREDRQARVRTLARRILSITWVATAVSLTLVALAGLFGGSVDPQALSGVLSVILAAPVLVTGVLTGERWLNAVAAGWWAGGAVMLFIPGVYQLLLMAAMFLLLMAVPGAILSARARRRQRVAA